MDDKAQQKERLEQELRFLKESFEAEVISKEEFEKGKERVEKKLKEIEKAAKKQEKAKIEVKEETTEAVKEKQEVSEETKKEEVIEKKEKIEVQEKQKTEEITKTEQPKKEVQEEKLQEIKVDEAIETKEEEKIKLKVIQDEAEHEHFEPVRIKVDAAKKIEETITREPKTGLKEEKKESKFFKYAIIFVVLLLIVFFSYYLWRGNLKPQEKLQKAAEIELETPKINVIVLNDKKNCFNCDTQRVLGILESWFGALNVEEINYNTNEGKAIVEKFNAKLLPIYILEENITKKTNFEQFKRVFIKKGNNYILSEDVAASTFYFKRENMSNKLDLFVISGDSASIKAENNLKEFLDTFKDVKFEKHLSTDKLAQELNIKTFPTFLINNKVKFSGIHSAETIKENFCKLNKLPACEKSLSKSLV